MSKESKKANRAKGLKGYRISHDKGGGYRGMAPSTSSLYCVEIEGRRFHVDGIEWDEDPKRRDVEVMPCDGSCQVEVPRFMKGKAVWASKQPPTERVS